MKEEKDREDMKLDEIQKNAFSTGAKGSEDIDDLIFEEEGYRCSER